MSTEELEGPPEPPPPADEPILPTTFDAGELRDAVGAPPRRRGTEPREDPFEDDEPSAARRKRRTVMIAAGSIVVGLSVAALVFLGRANSERLLVTCGADRVTAEQGRAFPPWGSHPLAGAEWKPIALPANSECKPRETDDRDELGRWFLDQLLDRASTTLTNRNLLETIPATGAGTTNPLDVVAAQLEQALLLARSPDRRDQRKEIERLQGDVQYWRASARARDVAAAVLDAAKQFDAAATLRPRHASDAGAWAAFLRRVDGELRAGPGAPPANAPPPAPVGPAPEPTAAAPQGSALPVEPPTEPAGSAAPTPDAGMPAGGVLL